jgi:hypothetical protein
MSYYHDDDGSDEESATAAVDAILFWVIVGLAGIVGVCVALQWLFPI